MVSKRTKYPPNNNGSDIPISGRCGAKLRHKNKYCKNWPINGTGKCRLHGGIVKDNGSRFAKGHTRATKHGLYAETLTGEDESVYFQAELGTVDEEIRMAKVQVARAYRAQQAYDLAIERGDIDKHGMILMEVTITRGEVCEIKKVKRRDDFKAEIRHSSRLVAKLEGLRSELLKNTSPQHQPDSPLNKLVAALSSIRNGNSDKNE